MLIKQSKTIAIVGVLIGGLLVAMIESADAQDKKAMGRGETVRINTFPGSIINLPIWVMNDQGFCRERNLKCDPTDIPSAPLALQALVGGSLDLNFSATDVALQSVSRGNKIKIVGALAPNNIFTLNVGNEVPLPNLKAGYPAVMQDLKGKRIGVTARGAATEIMTRALFAGAGVDPDSVTYVAVGSPATSYPMLVAKQIDAAMMFEPFATLCRTQKSCVTAVSLANGDGPADVKALNGAFLPLLATDSYIAANPHVVKAFVEGMADAIDWTQKPENFAKVLKIAKSHMSLGNLPDPETLLEELVKAEIPTLGVRVDRKSVAAYSDLLLKYKVTDKPVTVDAIVYADAP
ncbi:MAG: ABC transporter substrate-binding protein [Afipia sp.]